MNRMRTANLILKWIARVFGTMLFVLVLIICIGEGVPNIFKQPITVQIEFSGMFVLLIGLIIGWKWQALGGILILAGNMAFHIIEAKLYINLAFALFDLTGLLYITGWFLNRFPESIDET